MAAIGNWSLVWWHELSARPEAAAAVMAELRERRRAAATALGECAIEALGEARSVLSLSYSSSVENILGNAGASALERVVIGEGRPRLEGRRLAQSLHGRIRRVELITDAQLAHFAARVDHVLLGADSICADGSAVNKVGSLAAAFAAAGVPCLIAADSYKLNPAHTAETIPLEEMSAEEVWPEQPELCRNVYFEPVPARLITAYATEKGVLTAAQLAPELERWRRLHARFHAAV